MKIFADTGSLKDIETIAALGILDGVTTNPSLLAKEPGDFRQNLKRICEIVNGPVSGEVTATDFAGMMQQGRQAALDIVVGRGPGGDAEAPGHAPLPDRPAAPTR